jgi:hypothetical protein
MKLSMRMTLMLLAATSGLAGLSANDAQANVQALDRDGIYQYLLSGSPVVLNVYILRSTLRPQQVGPFIQTFNHKFSDPRFNSHCEATVQVVPNSYVPHNVRYDSTAYGVFRVQVTHTCLSALNQAFQAFEESPYIDVKAPNVPHPAVVISN